MTQKSKLEKRLQNEMRRVRFVNKILIDRIEYLEDKVDEHEQNTAMVLQAMTDHLIQLHRKVHEDGGDGIDPIMHEGIESE